MKFSPSRSDVRASFKSPIDQPTNRRCGRSGFSLIEVLVVVSIIGVLAALVFPSIQSMRGKAERSECAQNLRQIGIGMHAYANEHDGWIPKTGGAPWNQENTWGYEIWPYIYGSHDNFDWRMNALQMNRNIPGAAAGKNVFRCPSTRKEPIGVAGTAVPVAVMSYGFNADPAGQVYNRNQRIKLARLTAPSKTMMVIESSNAPGDFQGYTLFGLIPHSEGSNALYFDGHAAWSAYEAIPKTATDVFWDGTE